ncbi:MAG: hypothetical protein ACOYMS_03590, partial [Terrimicrobiaceae bacterium]
GYRVMSSINPFPNDPDRHEIWEILMRRDFEAFIAADWSRTAGDFLEEEFFGLDGDKVSNPDQWRLRFPDLVSYRDEWLAQAAEFAATELKGCSKLDFFFQSVVLREIEITGSRAVAHKKFDGAAESIAGEPVRILWQTLYFLKKRDGRWRITGFVGYLPNPMPGPSH